MTLFALSPEASDALTVWGFAVGVIGLIVGVAGFGYTIYQVRKATTAAKQAKRAARKTLAESKKSYERFVAAFASRLLDQLQNAVNDRDWKLARIRSLDLAELLASLPNTGIKAWDTATSESVKGLRELGQTFADMLAEGKTKLAPKFVKEKWKPLLDLIHARLDYLRAPFRGSNDGQVRADDSAGEVPGNRSKPSSEDEGGAGELGPKPLG